MQTTSLSRACLVALAGFGVAAHAASPSASYPTKPVRVIVPLAPGGGSDIVGRMVAQGLGELWGKPVIIDNRPGAGSAVGTSIAARMSSDSAQP